MSYTDSMLANMASAKDLENKRVLREQLAKDVDRWLKKNKPTVLPGVQLKPRPERVVVKVKTDRVSRDVLVSVVNWANQSKHRRGETRRSLLAQVTGISKSRIVSIVTLTGSVRMTKGDYAQIQKAMPIVEKIEAELGLKTTLCS